MAKIIVVGLTGSIGMGKSETARMFRGFRVPVFDADAVVHRLLGPGGAAVALVGAAFPGIVKDGSVNRVALGTLVFGDTVALKKLEAILHPMVRMHEKRFFWQARARRNRLAVLDIPLLFEKGGAATCDYIVVTSAPAFIQRARVLARPHMTAAKFQSILARQVPDRQKRAWADFVIETGLGKRFARARVRRIIQKLMKRNGARR